MPIPIAAAALAPMAIQGVTGLAQLAGGLLTKAKRPELRAQQGIIDNAMLARQRAQSSRLAGQGAMEDQIQGAFQQTMQASREVGSASSILAAAQGAGATALQGTQKLASMGEQARQQSYSQLASANTALSDEQQRIEQFNVIDPYKAKAAQKSALLGAGIQNITGAATSFGEAATASLYTDKQGGIQSYLPSLFGTGALGTTG